MIAIKPTQMRDNFKSICDQVVGGEIVIVSRPNNENVVVVSEKEFNDMRKAARNAEYLATIDKSMEELKHGGFVIKTLEELRAYE
ncbi:type II toxin-antitoxin system Phd/YefM family antitoxin [Synergistaceae bacterium OttesenSCG-928-I11]|nr:type II toxin-antitoxin system Phd/YefM family antitoxin [Synergistaceae bacterium OttesenSCG-928-I11]